MTSQQFTIDVYNASDELIGPGPLFNILSVTVEEAIDLAGRITVVVPISDPRVTELVANEYRVGVRDKDGIVAYGILQEITTDLQPQTLSLTGPDRLGELLYLSTQYDREYENVATTSIIGTDASGTGLLRDTGWSQGTVSPSVTLDTISYDSQTILQALIALAKQSGDHFREGSTARTLDWGTFGDDSGIQFINPVQITAAQSEENPDLVYINQLQVGVITADIENRIYPLGSSKFDLRDASSASADILVRANRGPLGVSTLLVGAHGIGTTVWNVTAGTGTNFTVGEEIWIGTASTWANNHEVLEIQAVAANTVTTTSGSVNAYTGGEDLIQRFLFYVEDASSQATYGVRENTPQFNWIKSVDETDATANQQAADVLYNASKARLTRYSSAYRTIVLPEVFNAPPPSELRVGDKIRVTARIADADGQYALNIDELFYVVRITRTWTGDGRFTASFEVADVSRPAPNNVDFVLYNLDTNQWQGPK
jgi:hypothetical protein